MLLKQNDQLIKMYDNGKIMIEGYYKILVMFKKSQQQQLVFKFDLGNNNRLDILRKGQTIEKTINKHLKDNNLPNKAVSYDHFHRKNIQMLKDPNNAKHHHHLTNPLAKKPKKPRSTSTNQNKQNLSVSHNNSTHMLLDHLVFQGKGHGTKAGNMLKTKKTNNQSKRVLQEVRERSSSRMSNVQYDSGVAKDKQTKKKVTSQNGKCGNTKPHSKPHPHNSSSIFIQTQKPHASKPSQNPHPIVPNHFLQHPFNPNSRSSTLLSSSTGNIQFSQYSKDDYTHKQSNQTFKKYDKVMETMARPESSSMSGRDKGKGGWFMCDNLINTQKCENVIRQKGKGNLQKLTRNKAAIMIQKTWRGYLTRKLLEQYIASFQPMYEQQLKSIKSRRQSMIGQTQPIFPARSSQQKHGISAHIHSKHQQSKFFEQSSSSVTQRSTSSEGDKLDEYSEIQNVGMGQDSFNENVEASDVIDVGRLSCEEMPVQYFKKNNRGSNKTSGNDSRRSNNSERSNRNDTRQQSLSKVYNTNQSTTIPDPFNPGSTNPITQFTVTNPSPSHNHQQTIKSSHPQNTKISFKNLTIATLDPLTILPTQPSALQSLTFHCQQLSTLFERVTGQKMNELKQLVKEGRIGFMELNERKKEVKGIEENGKEFVKSVEDEIVKAFEEMGRIVREGLRGNGEEDDEEKDGDREKESDQDENEKDNKCDIHTDHTLPYHPQSPVSPYYASNRTPTPPHAHHPTSTFYTIQLPTQEYSSKARSLIHQQQQEDTSYQQIKHNPTFDQQQQSHSSYPSYQQSQQQQPTPSHRSTQSLEILNQFLVNLIEEYGQYYAIEQKSQLDFLCMTLRQISCTSENNRTVIDRCLIEFIVEIMAGTYTLREIYAEFVKVVGRKRVRLGGWAGNGQREEDIDYGDYQNSLDQGQQQQNKLTQMILSWIRQLQKWQMTIIQEVPSKMQSSSFINTQNISVLQLRDAITSLEGNTSINFNEKESQ